MLFAASLVVRTLYVVLPVLSLLAFVRPSPRALRASVAGGWISGMLVGGCVAAGYVIAMGGAISATQAAFACYFGVSLLLLLKLVDALIFNGTRRLFRAREGAFWRSASASLLRVVLMACFALPWVMAAVMVYRPRVHVQQSPADLLHTECDDVAFTARDGTRIAGWYLPSNKESSTVALLCHGLGSGRAGWLTLIDRLHRDGVNVLAIDLRAHGDSGGQLCSFGAREKLDPIAAVDWLKSTHPESAERIVGVGASLGSAALFAAAADDSRIDAVASLSTFDTLQNELNDVATRRMPRPLGWLARHLALPMASLHAGVDLRTVRPIDAIDKLWPRPVFIVHATGDEIIPFDAGVRLYQQATQPKQSLWIKGGSHNGLLEDPEVLKAVEQFVRNATAEPVI